MDEYESLSHSKWECKYHVVFIPKGRRKVLYKSLRQHLGEVFRKLAEQKQSRIEEGHLQIDHVHMMISIPPKYAVSQVVGFIKGKSAIHLARVYGERKQNYAGRNFWARGYFVSTVGRDEATIREYIRNQEQEDKRIDQLNMWNRPATVKVAQLNRGRVSDPAQAALSGSHRKAPGSAGGYLLTKRLSEVVMRKSTEARHIVAPYLLAALLIPGSSYRSEAQLEQTHITSALTVSPRLTILEASPKAVSWEYRQVQLRLAEGWNTWDVNSVLNHVLLPEGLAIHIGLYRNSTRSGDTFLPGALIGRLTKDAEQVTPGPHSWNGEYTDIQISWMGHNWRVQTAHDGKDLVLLAAPLPSRSISALPPTIVFSVNFLWDRPGMTMRHPDYIETRGASGAVPVYCSCTRAIGGDRVEESKPARDGKDVNIPIGGPYFSMEFTKPVGVSTGKRRSLTEIESIIDRKRAAYEKSITGFGKNGPTVDAIETTLGWDTIFEPEERRVISPVSRVWSIDRGGYVLFDWDSFFVSTMAAIGDRDLAYANAIETLRGSTPQGFVPNYSRSGGWKTFDRSEPPVGSIIVLALYRQFHDRWFLEDTFQPLLNWNLWWAKHRDIQGYLTWGSDGDNEPVNPDDRNRGTRIGAILESGLDNSPMYDDVAYSSQSHLLDFADVGLMSMYIADCDALATIAGTLDKPAEVKELRERSSRYKDKLQSLWDERTGMFLNKDLHTGQFGMRLSPTNFYPLLARVATPAQAEHMIQEHLLNPKEFWGKWIIPSIAIDDPAFSDQDYWRGRIWGPMNYLVYLGLRNYDYPAVHREFAEKSLGLFLNEWSNKRHVHENYNAITGSGDDVDRSDRFYHWGALLGYMEYMEQAEGSNSSKSAR